MKMCRAFPLVHCTLYAMCMAALAACTVWPLQGTVQQPVEQPVAPVALMVSEAGLQGKAWSALYIHGVGATTEPRPFLLWNQGAQISGSGGCNRFTGQVQMAEKEQMRFAGLVSTRMACMPEPGGQEDKFFMALERAQQARLEGEDLILLDAVGNVLAQLRRMDIKTAPPL